MEKTRDDLLNKKLLNIEWIEKYIEKINKNLNFLNNFDQTTLKQTYMEAFLDSNVKAILTVIGGYNSNQLLDYIDYQIKHSTVVVP